MPPLFIDFFTLEATSCWQEYIVWNIIERERDSMSSKAIIGVDSYKTIAHWFIQCLKRLGGYHVNCTVIFFCNQIKLSISGWGFVLMNVIKKFGVYFITNLCIIQLKKLQQFLQPVSWMLMPTIVNHFIFSILERCPVSHSPVNWPS